MLKMVITPRKATLPQRVTRPLRATLMRTESLNRETILSVMLEKTQALHRPDHQRPSHHDMMPGRQQSHGHIQDKGNNAMYANVL
jgi:hypothetical protein